MAGIFSVVIAVNRIFCSFLLSVSPDRELTTQNLKHLKMVLDTTSTSFDSSDDSLNEESLNSRYAKKREAAKRRKLQLQQRRLAKKRKIPNAVRIGEMTSSSSEFESPSAEPGESLVHDHVELKETSETSSGNPDSSEVVESTKAITERKSITRRLGNIFNRVHSFIGNLKKKTPESQKSDPAISLVEKSDFDECKSLQEADELQVVRSQSTGLQELSDELEIGEDNGNFATENLEKLEEKVTGFSKSLVPAPVTDVTPKGTSTQEVNEKKLTFQEYLAGLNGNGNNMETRTLDLELVGDEQFEDGQDQNTPITSEHLPRVRTFKELNQEFQETVSKAKLEISMVEETMRRRREGVVEEKPMVTEVEEDSRISEESFWKVMREAAEEGSISFPLFQEIMKKRRESAEKMTTSESEPKEKKYEEEVKTKKTEILDMTDYKKKFLNASKHCREAQEEMKLAVNKAERFEKKAKRTDELERKMKEMEKEMQRMNRKLAAQAQQAEEIERLKAKILKKETVEKQLRAEKKELIRKNQELQLEIYKSKKTPSTPETADDFLNLDELQKMKDDFPREEILNEMKEMAEKVQTISNSSENVKVAEYELIRMEKTINIYLDTLEINIQKIKKTHDNSELFPLPRVPCFSEMFLRIYFDEIDKLPSDAQGIPDTDCLICHVFRESDEKTIQCATCNKVYHLDCAQQWFKTKRTCPHCCEWFKPTKESMVNNNINNCWKL
ncbi:hypothetical protein GCK72_010996 [Caenorhabditis remanei]|uniref:RING-type domain-containing protein n=1 Tax=Caenorhabditis remanei TaxID=31234 RepID=A0A6A5H7H1_CAERE|nr:hypothetical protein GCK72_010996 [Caenorhabditis remanei]KAF1762734.1 hypothetical protein GCK72_010996 [Caenorhabditis remanei]